LQVKANPQWKEEFVPKKSTFQKMPESFLLMLNGHVEYKPPEVVLSKGDMNFFFFFFFIREYWHDIKYASSDKGGQGGVREQITQEIE
jgi:hypothetical protein